MPQLGETVTEGTITKWLKAVGEPVALDEPLFEVSTDKVDSEVPSPVAGVLTEIVVPEGDTVDVGARLAVIGDAGDAPAAPPAESAAEPAESAPAPAAEPPTPPPPPPPAPAPAPAAPPPPAPAPAAPSTAPAAPSASTTAGLVTSPLVRRMISDRGLDPARIVGTGEGGRITRRDVESAGTGGAARGSATPAPMPARVVSGDERVPFDNIRRRTAEHMVMSKAVSAHVATAVEIDFEGVERVRRTRGDAFRAEEGFG
ncbi:MAG: E3 binding domain-containing protein, partial [Acidimicrobiia bacterium]|nr:E3 binding domain-containing protein [Acidimicrobiia bacterium]